MFLLGDYLMRLKQTLVQQQKSIRTHEDEIRQAPVLVDLAQGAP